VTPTAINVLQAVALTLVAIGAPAVVMVDDPLRQAMVFGIVGFFLTALFFVLQAPDVALSMLAVSSVLIPVLVVLALRRVRIEQQRDTEEGPER
jgi:uncharacterized MnhB-related membrane protein